MGYVIVIGSIYASGCFVHRAFFRSSDVLKAVTLPFAFGLVLFPSIFAMSYYLSNNFDFAFYSTPIVSMILLGASKKFKHETVPWKRDNKLIVMLLVVLVIAITTRFFYDSWLERAADPHFHLSAINSIKNDRVLPPDTACLPGEKFQYPWFYHLIAAVLLTYAKTSSIYVFSIFGVFIAAVGICMAYILGDVLGINKISFTLLVVAWSTFFILQVDPHPTALILMLLFFYCLFNYDKDRTIKMAFLSSAIAAATFYFHGLTFIFVVLVLFSYSIIRMLQKDYNYRHAPWLFMPLALALPFYLSISSTASEPFLFVPFGGFVQRYETLGPLLLGMIGGYIAVRKNDKKMTVFVSLLITLFAFLSAFILKLSQNIDRFVEFMFLPLSVLLLYWSQKIPKMARYAVISMAIVWMLWSPIIQVTATTGMPFVQTDEYAVSVWIKDHSTQNQEFIGAPTPVYLTGSERKTVFCEDGFLRGMFYPPSHIKRNFEDMIILYTNPSRELVEKHNIAYFIVGDRERSFFDAYDLQPYDFASSGAFVKTFQSGSYAVYSVNATKLPQTVSRSNLNYTYYSRWWEI